MITYNHEDYIVQAIESVLRQKTSFDFELVICDDCSTDRTVNRIVDYLSKHAKKNIVNFHKNEYNLGVLKNYNQSINLSKGQYIAICEGDDYWTDNFKLEKQMNVMLSNHDIGLVYTKANVFYQEENEYKHTVGLPYKFKNDILLFNGIPSLTTIYKKSLWFDFNESNLLNENSLLVDYPFWMFIAMNHKIEFLDEVTGVYRVLASSASHYSIKIELSQFKEQVLNYKIRFAKIYKSEKDIKLSQIIQKNIWTTFLEGLSSNKYDLSIPEYSIYFRTFSFKGIIMKLSKVYIIKGTMRYLILYYRKTKSILYKLIHYDKVKMLLKYRSLFSI